MITALVPMKANSERVPHKNFKNLGGKPLFRWIIDSLLAADCVSKVVINTDARGELSKAGVPNDRRLIIRDRPSEICGDFISMNAVIKDDLECLGGGDYLMTHTTNPFLATATIESAIKLYKARSPESDSLFSVNKLQTRFYDRDAVPINHDPDNLMRTQDLEPYFEENSCLYLFSYESFLATGSRIGKTPIMLPIAKRESVDIDTQEDWDFAEALSNAYSHKVVL